MFTGIIEALGILEEIQIVGTNRIFGVSSPISDALKVDQSLAHQGVCLTVTAVKGNRHWVTAVEETLNRSCLGKLGVGDVINLERAMAGNARFDGHVVQGHIDGIGHVIAMESKEGSWEFTFDFPKENSHLLVNKGSVCINGVSLTVIEPDTSTFRVAIIPYTFEHTHFKFLKLGDPVNLEYDILGKYISRYMALCYNPIPTKGNIYNQ